MILVPTFDNLTLLGTLLVPSGTCWLHFGRPSVTGACHCTLFCTIWGTGGEHRTKGRRNSPPTVSIHAIWLIQGFTFWRTFHRFPTTFVDQGFFAKWHSRVHGSSVSEGKTAPNIQLLRTRRRLWNRLRWKRSQGAPPPPRLPRRMVRVRTGPPDCL